MSSAWRNSSHLLHQQLSIWQHRYSYWLQLPFSGIFHHNISGIILGSRSANETMLHCNAVSNWQRPYPERSLYFVHNASRRVHIVIFLIYYKFIQCDGIKFAAGSMFLSATAILLTIPMFYDSYTYEYNQPHPKQLYVLMNTRLLA